MNKKGTHVDWAISMGIFLVYLIGMFILLRPGVTPVYKPEGLLKILEDKLTKEIMWEIKEVPIIMHISCSCEVLGTITNPRIELEVSNDWKFSKFIDPKEFLNEHHDKWKSGNTGVLYCASEECCVVEKPPEKIYTVIIYPNKPNPGPTDLKLTHQPENEANCKTSLGATISKEGVNYDWLKALKDEDYETLRDKWLPKDKEFAIWYQEPGEDKLKLLIGAEEPQGVNIFTKEFKTQYVYKEGGIDIPLIINIRLW